MSVIVNVKKDAPYVVKVIFTGINLTFMLLNVPFIAIRMLSQPVRINKSRNISHIPALENFIKGFCYLLGVN